jgi:hypothetical protein
MFLGQRTLTYNRKRVVHKYDDILQDNDYRYYCLSRDAVMIIVSLLNKHGKWDGTYADSVGVGTYTTVNSAQFDIIERLVDEAIEEMATGQVFDMSGVITAINGVADKIDDIELSLALSGDCGCVTTGTGITEPTPTTLDECIPPPGFDDVWEAYKVYACKAAVWTWDKIKIFSEYAKNFYFNLHEDWYNGQANDRLGLQQVFQRAAAQIGHQLDPLYLYNLNEGNKAFLAQFQADMYYKFATDYFLRVPETHSGATVIAEWYGNTWGHIQSFLDSEKADFLDDMFNAENATDAKSFIDNLIDDALTYAAAQGGTQLAADEISDIFTQLKSLGVAQLGFEYAPQINAYVHSETCSGTKGCVAPSSCWQSVTFGQHAGGDDWIGVFNPQSGWYEVDLAYDDTVTDLLSANHNGPTSPAGRNIWHVYDDGPTLIYNSDSPPASLQASVSRVHVVSTTAFDIVLNISCGGA